MLPLLLHAALYFGAFLAIWLGAGFVLSGITSLAKSWRLPPFTLSFFLLGMLTSLPEMAIGTVSILNQDPQIFVGNLLGGVIVLLLLVIPLRGLVGKPIQLPPSLTMKDIVLLSVVIAFPTLMTYDRLLTPREGWLFILLYGAFFLLITKEQSLVARLTSLLQRHSKHWFHIVIKIIGGVAILFFASQQIINSTLFFAQYFHIAPFFMSLIVVALGTSIPELSIAIRSFYQRENPVALADYLGSAVANTILLGIMLVVYGQPIQLPNHFAQRMSFLVFGLVTFYFFARSQRKLTRGECLVMLTGYITFVATEILLLR